MRGRTVSINMPLWANDSYIQINIYGTSLKGLCEEGVDIKHILQHIGHRSVVMDVPITSPDSQLSTGNPNVCRVRSSEGFHGHSRNGNDEEPNNVTEATVWYDPVEAFTSFDSSNNTINEEQGNPLTSTPIADKNGGSFESFILGRACDGSHTVAHPNLDCSPSLIRALPGLFTSSDTAPSAPGNSQNADVDDLFQDCIDDFDEANSHSIPHPSRCMMEDENDTALCTIRVPGFGSTTSPVMEIDGPDDDDIILVENLPHSNEIRQGMELINEDVETALNTAMICYEIDDDPCSSHDGGHSQDECQSSIGRKTGSLSITVDAPLANAQDLRDQMDAAVSSSCLSPRKAVGVELDHFSDAESSTTKSGALSENPDPKQAHFQSDGNDECMFEQDHSPSEASEDKDISPNVHSLNSRIYLCRMPGCGKKLMYRRRYGKLRLLDHVRTHWSKAVKLCKVCDYKASCPQKVYRHHKVKHGGMPYTGPASVETKNDMEQLLRLYKQCFPGLPVHLKWFPPTP